MAETVRLTVQEQNQQVPMQVERARIIEAISPKATVERVEDGVRFTVTDYQGTTSEVINDGEPGEPGQPGQPGQPGVSPTVTVTDITGGHRITVTDATGPHSFDVMDGEPGEPGDPAELIDDTSTTAEDRTWSAKHLNNEIDAKQDAPETAGTDGQFLGMALVDGQLVPVWTGLPIGTNSAPGIVRPNYGLTYNAETGVINIDKAANNFIRTGEGNYNPIVASTEHLAVFYGLAKIAGSSEANNQSPGTYTESAKSAIAQMLNAPVSVSGSTPSITAKPGVRYVCGEVATLTITAPASGCIDVIFTSGSTATVLTVSSAKTGVTAIKWANGFDPTSLDANTTYEVNILDGEFGVVGSWT